MATLSFFDARKQLTKLRDENHRQSRDVVDLWVDVVAKSRSKLGDELWTVYEQVCIAACDTGEIDLAINCVEQLQKQFPSSHRVMKLEGLINEATNNFQSAHDIYNKILKEEPANSLAMKRLIAILKANQRHGQAIRMLNAYLEKYSADLEAWLELCDLYIAEMDYTKAAFCCEEVILHNPRNHLYHQKYADILYTDGGRDNIELACKYYAQSVKMNGDNMRSLYGLILTSTILMQSAKSTPQFKKEMTKLNSWTKHKISEKYKACQSSTDKDMAIIEETLESLNI